MLSDYRFQTSPRRCHRSAFPLAMRLRRVLGCQLRREIAHRFGVHRRVMRGSYLTTHIRCQDMREDHIRYQ